MKRTAIVFGVALVLLLAAGHNSLAQRGGRGGGVSRGGGAISPGRVASPSVGTYSGGVGTRSSSSVVGPAGGTRTVGSGSGSYTTKGGSTIDYAGAGRTATGPGGVTAGRGVGGVTVTTPGGKTATKVGTAGGIAGPGGNAVGTKGSITTGSGPGGSFTTANRGGIAVGPGGVVAGGTRVGTATGPGGTITGGTRTGVAAGPYGAVAGKTTVARGTNGTRYASSFSLATTGGAVRTNFAYHNTFTPGWYAKYPGAWFAAGWTAARIWTAPTWGYMSGYCGYPAEPAYYDYGETVVYNDNTVTINGETTVPAEEYMQQATDLANTGKEAKVQAKADDFQTLGVFAMVGEGETKSTNIFQLAINKDGIIRGNYYNALTDTTETVYGSVDKKTQRAAWTVADRKTPIYEAGIANLTKDETTMLVHFAKDNSQQFTLVRIPQPEDKPAEGK